MTRHERLREAYEEALFALLMEDVSEEEGARLIEENRRLQEDPSAAVPEEVDRRCLKAIKKSFSKERRRQAGRVTCRVLGNVSMAIVLCMLLFVTAFAASPKLRVTTLNLLIEISDTSAELTLVQSGADGPHSEDADGVTAGYAFGGYLLPEQVGDFCAVNSSMDRRSLYVEYRDSGGKLFQVMVTRAGNNSHSVDAEDADCVDELQVFGCDGLLIEKGGSAHLVWGDTQRGVYVDIYGAGFDTETILEFSGGIELTGES